jgi:hypothetical protein
MMMDKESGTLKSLVQEERESWAEYRRLVLAELDRVNKSLDRLNGELSRMKTDIALLQLKASAWGAMSGAVVAIGIILMRFLQ